MGNNKARSRMFRKTLRITAAGAAIVLLMMFSALHTAHGMMSQEIDARLQQLTKENAEGYLHPLLRAVSSNMHRGLYHKAPRSRWGIDIYLGMKAIAAFVPESDKVYQAYFDGVKSETATIVGDRGKVIAGDNAECQFPDGFRWDIIPLLIPQLQIGNVYGTQIVLRYLPSTIFDEKIGEIDVYGGGIQHSLSQYIPSFPLDISIQGAYHVMKIGNFLDASGHTYGFMASKTFAILTLYGSVGMGATDFVIQYNYNPVWTVQSASSLSAPTSGPIRIEKKIEERIHGTLGLSLRLIIFKLNADYTFGDYTIATIGIGIAI